VIQWKAIFKRLDIVPTLYIAAFKTRLHRNVQWSHHFVNDGDDIKKKPNKKDLALYQARTISLNTWLDMLRQSGEQMSVTIFISLF
jgi:hypothetical protein